MSEKSGPPDGIASVAIDKALWLLLDAALNRAEVLSQTNPPATRMQDINSGAALDAQVLAYAQASTHPLRNVIRVRAAELRKREPG